VAEINLSQYNLVGTRTPYLTNSCYNSLYDNLQSVGVTFQVYVKG